MISTADDDSLVHKCPSSDKSIKRLLEMDISFEILLSRLFFFKLVHNDKKKWEQKLLSLTEGVHLITIVPGKHNKRNGKKTKKLWSVISLILFYFSYTFTTVWKNKAKTHSHSPSKMIEMGTSIRNGGNGAMFNWQALDLSWFSGQAKIGLSTHAGKSCMYSWPSVCLQHLHVAEQHHFRSKKPSQDSKLYDFWCI